MSSSEKTIIFISNESKLFGAPKVLLQIIRYFHSLQSYNLLVVCPSDGPFKSALDQINIRVLIPDCLSRFYMHVSQQRFVGAQFWLRAWDNIKLFFYFYKLFNSYVDPIIYANTSVVRYIAIPAKLSRARLLWHIHEYFANPIKQRFHAILVRSCADKIIVHSPGLISRLYLTKPQVQNKVIYFRYFSAIEKEILSRSDPNVKEYDIIFAGRVSLKKGVLDLLQAIAYLTPRMPNLKAAIVGMSAKEDEPIIKNFVAENKLENHVIFTGFVPDIYEYVLKSKIVVLPTHRDYFPMILLESILLERPIIATEVGDIPTIIAHGKNGLLVEPGNISQLADSIEKILDEKEYARFKVGVQLTKEQILAQTNDYQIIKKIIDQCK